MLLLLSLLVALPMVGLYGLIFFVPFPRPQRCRHCGSENHLTCEGSEDTATSKVVAGDVLLMNEAEQQQLAESSRLIRQGHDLRRATLQAYYARGGGQFTEHWGVGRARRRQEQQAKEAR